MCRNSQKSPNRDQLQVIDIFKMSRFKIPVINNISISYFTFKTDCVWSYYYDSFLAAFQGICFKVSYPTTKVQLYISRAEKNKKALYFRHKFKQMRHLHIFISAVITLLSAKKMKKLFFEAQGSSASHILRFLTSPYKSPSLCLKTFSNPCSVLFALFGLCNLLLVEKIKF